MQENIWLQLPSVFLAHSPPILISSGLSGGVRERLKCSHPLHTMMKRWNQSTRSRICRALHLDENITLPFPVGEEGTVYDVFWIQPHFSSTSAPRWQRQSAVLRLHDISISYACSDESTKTVNYESRATHVCLQVASQQFIKGGWTWHTCIQPMLSTLPKVRYCDGKYLRWKNTYSCISTSTSTHACLTSQEVSLLFAPI